ncbi:MAG: hypothetical protein JNG86_13480, partial [Verrucomicrobiaceae bacterium]|nr:hypothetical protein [Verrucomicrobiaceae bacterium]
MALSRANQIADTAAVTINGGARFQLNRFDETIASLTFNNDGGSNGNTAPSVDSGGGILTVTGAITAAAHSNAISIPVLNGFLNVAGGQTFNIADSTVIPGQAGLALNAALIGGGTITKTGTGFLGIGGQSGAFTGIVNVNNGGLAFTQGTANLGNGQVVLAGGTVIDTRGLTGVIGSLSGTGVVRNYNLNGQGTLVTGLNNLDTTFGGVFHSPFVQGRLNVQKIGTGTWTIAGDSSSSATVSTSNTFTVSQGGVRLDNGSAKLNFINYTLNSTGSLTLDNSINVVSSRLGTATYADASTAAGNRVMTISGGTLNFLGGAGAVAEQINTLNITNGGGFITMTAGTGATQLTIGTLAAPGTTGGTAVFRGAGLGGVVGAGSVNIVATTPNLSTGGGGAAGTTTMSIRPDILGDLSATGSGTGFVTHVATTGFRLLTDAEHRRPTVNTYLGNALPLALQGTTNDHVGNTDNVRLTQSKAMHVNTTVNSLTLGAGGGYIATSGNSTVSSPEGQLFGANAQMLTLTISSGGLLGLAGNTGTRGGQIVSGSNTLFLQGVADVSVGSYIGGTGGITKAGPGVVTLNRGSFNTGITTVN